MGAQCSCNGDFDEIPSQSLAIPPQQLKQKIDAVVKIQAVARMLQQKKKFKKKIEETTFRTESKPTELTWEEKIRIKMGPVKYPDYSLASPRGTYQREITLTEEKIKYRGEWNTDGEKEGRGIEKHLEDGAIYEGEFSHDKPNGYGRMIKPNGTVYEGKWLDGKRECFGKFEVLDQKITYQGQWHNDQQHGRGREQWPDGSQYDGDYFEGKKHGKGFFKWGDKSSYDGQFFENNIEGFGTYTQSDGRKYVGEFKNNKMHGKGTFTWADGRCYVGEYANDLKEGQGTFTWCDGRKYEGAWEKGVQHGEGTLTLPDGRVKHGVWSRGKHTR